MIREPLSMYTGNEQLNERMADGGSWVTNGQSGRLQANKLNRLECTWQRRVGGDSMNSCLVY